MPAMYLMSGGLDLLPSWINLLASQEPRSVLQAYHCGSEVYCLPASVCTEGDNVSAYSMLHATK